MVRRWTKRSMRSLLRRAGGSFERAGEMLGVSRQAVQKTAKRLGLTESASEIRTTTNAKKRAVHEKRSEIAKRREAAKRAERERVVQEAKDAELRDAIWRCRGNLALLAYELDMTPRALRLLVERRGMIEEARNARRGKEQIHGTEQDRTDDRAGS